MPHRKTWSQTSVARKHCPKRSVMQHPSPASRKSSIVGYPKTKKKTICPRMVSIPPTIFTKHECPNLQVVLLGCFSKNVAFNASYTGRGLSMSPGKELQQRLAPKQVVAACILFVVRWFWILSFPEALLTSAPLTRRLAGHLHVRRRGKTTTA